jgi:hypothetical protein
MYYCKIYGVICAMVDHEDGSCAALRGYCPYEREDD